MMSSGRSSMLCVWLLGLGLFLLGIISIPIVNMVIRSQIIKKVLLVNSSDSQLYPVWRDPHSLPIYLEVYVFHLSNPDEVLQGHKPYLIQRGPYTYSEKREKVDIVHNDNGTVTYRQIKTYHFVRDKSIGPDSDTFTSVNIPFMTLVEYLKWHSALEDYVVSEIVRLFFSSEKMFISRSVRDVMFGYHDPMLTLGMTLDSSRFYTDFIGVLAGKNDTDDGTYTIFTGEKDITKLGVIDRYNGSSHLRFWTSDQCNRINGTDGTIGPPFIPKSMIIGMFSTDICRSVFGTFYKDVYSAEGIHLYRFRSPIQALERASDFPPNAGFCTPAGNCMGTGVLNISTCQILDGFHIPVVASNPHFYRAEKRYQEAVIGLNPDPELHDTDIDLEPNTGLLMHIAKRLQINIYIEPIKDIKQTANIASMVYPVLWVNESMTIDRSHAEMVKHQLLIPQFVSAIMQYVVITLGAAIMLSSTATLCLRQKQAERRLPSASISSNPPCENDLTHSPPDGTTINDSNQGAEEEERSNLRAKDDTETVEETNIENHTDYTCDESSLLHKR